MFRPVPYGGQCEALRFRKEGNMDLLWNALNLSWHALGYFAVGMLAVIIVQSALSNEHR